MSTLADSLEKGENLNTQAEGPNTRLAPRYTFSENEPRDIRLFNLDGTQDLRALNLSPSGIAFSGPQNLQNGDVIKLQIRAFEMHPFECQARVVRSQAAENNLVYGAQFLGLPLLMQDRLHQAIRSASMSQQIDNYLAEQKKSTPILSAETMNRLFWIAITALIIILQAKLVFR